MVDIPFPRQVRDEVVAAGLAEPHHIFPDTEWVSIWLRGSDDVERAIRLLERLFALGQAHADRRAEREGAGASSPSSGT